MLVAGLTGPERFVRRARSFLHQILSVTDTGRRRRWTDAEKVRIVEESFGPRGSVPEAARHHDVGRTLLVRWWRRYRNGELASVSTTLMAMPEAAMYEDNGAVLWKNEVRRPVNLPRMKPKQKSRACFDQLRLADGL